MEKKYEIYQVIVSDEEGKLYNFNSDYMNENFEVTEHDILIPLEGENNDSTWVNRDVTAM